jgi:hypothetical protein
VTFQELKLVAEQFVQHKEHWKQPSGGVAEQLLKERRKKTKKTKNVGEADR